jgi:hypothetical protein
MNYKSIVIIALALCLVACVPVSAMWNNGNWVSADHNTKCDSTSFDPQTGVTSCYKDINPAKQSFEFESERAFGGIAVGSIRAGYSTLSNTITVRNVLQPENLTPMVIDVLPDATFRIPKDGDGVLAPGNYTATLDNFNLPDETVEFTIAANQQEPTRISFIGQAVSSEPAKIISEPTVCPTHDCKGKFVLVDIAGIFAMNIHKTSGFYFDNAQNPGGIFDATTNTRINTIADPAYGQVKDVFILYSETTGTGTNKHTTFNIRKYEEYEHISFGSNVKIWGAVYGERTCVRENQPRLPS